MSAYKVLPGAKPWREAEFTSAAQVQVSTGSRGAREAEGWFGSMSVYDAGQFDIAVIGAGHMGPRRAGRA